MIESVLVLNVEHGTFTKEEINVDDINEYYRLIGCDAFDIARRSIGGKMFDIFIDDEGLLKDSPIPSAITVSGHKDNQKITPVLFGNLVFTTNDGPATHGVSESDMLRIVEKAVTVYDSNGNGMLVVVLD